MQTAAHDLILRAIMYRVDRNNFYHDAKSATIYTPGAVSAFLFGILDGRLARDKPVIDPCVGAGSLLMPFRDAGYATIGIDIEHQGWPETRITDFLAIRPGQIPAPGLVIANPPFNIDAKTGKRAAAIFGGRPLLPEVWLHHAIRLWGREVPMCLFTPYGLRLNQSARSRRWQAFVRGDYPEIASIISLPKDIYDGVLFHSEILVFNIAGLKPHYFFTP